MFAGCASTIGPDEELITLEIGPQLVECTGVGPTRCMLVRTLPDQTWVIFHGAIEGFVHETGYRSVLEVARRRIPDPPADGSSLHYRLVRVLLREPA
jgi:hypothetical protein